MVLRIEKGWRRVWFIEMRIRDDGQGFDTGKASAPGYYGLSMMRERADAVRADLTVSSQPGHGSEVRLLWPGTSQKEKR
jgi:two-component system nitrate/nitrite sensor histidine kinase NarX